MDGRKLRRLLKAYGWSQTEFAQRAGISQATISLICNGSRQPSLDLLDRICLTLGITHAELLGDSDGVPEKDFPVNALLTPDESAMLARYRTLASRDQRAVLALIDSLTYPESNS